MFVESAKCHFQMTFAEPLTSCSLCSLSSKMADDTEASYLSVFPNRIGIFFFFLGGGGSIVARRKEITRRRVGNQ